MEVPKSYESAGCAARSSYFAIAVRTERVWMWLAVSEAEEMEEAESQWVSAWCDNVLELSKTKDCEDDFSFWFCFAVHADLHGMEGEEWRWRKRKRWCELCGG